MKKYLLSILLFLPLAAQAQISGSCPTGFNAILSGIRANGVAFTLPEQPAHHFLCADAAGNLLTKKTLALNSSFAQSRTPRAAVSTAQPGDGVTVVADAATRTVTLTMATAVMQANQLVAWYTIKDEPGTGLTHNITVVPAAGTIDGAASASILTNFGVLRAYCTSTNCFTR